MIKILIDIPTIKENTGRRDPGLPIKECGPTICTISMKGPFPKELNGISEATEWEIKNGKQISWKGYIDDPENIEPILKLSKEHKWKGLKIESKTEIINNYTIFPEPAYIYRFINYKLECNECHAMVLPWKIVIDYESDGEDYSGPIQTCPICQSVETFEDWGYETIEEALKRKNEK